MIVIDAREGVSGDMLLAAMLGMFDQERREDHGRRLGSASHEFGVEMVVSEVEEGGERGLGISYLRPEPFRYGSSYDECFRTVRAIDKAIDSDGKVSGGILEAIFDAEGEAHGVDPTEVHLHELARPQALMNIAGIGLLSSELLKAGAGGFVSTTITTGKGLVVVGHGAVRVPPPVSEILLRGLRHEMGDAPGERATPTGIAAIKVLARSQVETVPTTHTRKAVGFGTKRFAGRLGRTSLIAH